MAPTHALHYVGLGKYIMGKRKRGATVCDHLILVSFAKYKSAWGEIFAFFSVMLVHMPVLFVDNISHFGLIVSLFSTDKKVSRVLVYSSTFYYPERGIKGIVLRVLCKKWY